jgi:predicted nucleic acid-binding protein
MHAINLGEVYYDTLRVSGKDKADELFADMALLPISIVWTVDVPLLALAGKYKTSYRISYADAFVLALADQEKATVISTDHHEFDPVENAGDIPFLWLR